MSLRAKASQLKTKILAHANSAPDSTLSASAAVPETLYQIKQKEIGSKRFLALGNNGSRGDVIIGKWTYYGNTRFNGFHPNDFLYVGNFCSIADDVKIFLCNGHHFPSRPANYPIDTYFGERVIPAHKCFTHIGHDVWIGSGAIIMPGVRIGNGAVIGAGSIVTKDVADYTIVAGNPAKQIGTRCSDNDRYVVQNASWWLWSDELLKERSELFTGDIKNFVSFVNKHKLIRDKGVPEYYYDEIPEMFNIPMGVDELQTKVREFLCLEDSAFRIHKHKTQSFANLMVWMAAFMEIKPKTIVEFGTQTGCSSSIFARMARFLGLKTKIITINIADELVYRDPDVEYVIEDFTDKVAEIWKHWSPDIVFQDAHMYALIEQQLKEGELKHRKTVHFFHDVGYRLFQNPMKIPQDAVPTSATGSWERHVIAKLYSKSLLNVSTRKYEDKKVKIHIFDACADSNEFGLGVLKFK